MADDTERVTKLIVQLTRLKELGKLTEHGERALKQLIRYQKGSSK